MFFSSWVKVYQSMVASKVAEHHAPVAVANFKSNFKVERGIVSMLPVADKNHGFVLQVVCKEQAKKVVEIEMDMEIVQVMSRSSKRSSQFDISDVSQKKKKRVVAAVAAVEMICIHSQGEIETTETGYSTY